MRGNLARLYEKENPRFKIDFCFHMRENENISLKARCDGIEVDVVSDCVAEKASRRAITEEDISGQLSKLGGTQFYMGNISTDIADGLSVPISAINKLLSELKFLTHTDVQTEPGSPTLRKLRLLSTVHRVV